MMVTMENPSIVMDISGEVVNMAILTVTSAGALILRGGLSTFIVNRIIKAKRA
jgi:hypothetical protein